MPAVGVDSLGWEEYHRRAYRVCGLSVTWENVLGWRQRDRNKQIQRNYRKRSDVERNMALRQHSKIMEELQKEHEDFLNGKTYETNISAPGEEPDGGEGGEESIVSIL
jgi:hypothetical protein